MTALRVLFNTVEAIDAADVFPRLKALGVVAVSVFCELDRAELHPNRAAAEQFGEVNANLMHAATFHDEPGWEKKLRADCARLIPELAAHVGVWIAAPTDGSVQRHLRDAVSFLKERGHDPIYVEVGYPTHGFKPLAGLYGWGREKDQAAMLKTCYAELSDLGVPWMQICECIDPAGEQVYDSRLMGDEGRVPKAFGIVPVSEERHWGLLNADGSEKEACEWVAEVAKGSGTSATFRTGSIV